MLMNMAMSIRTITLIAIPIATDLVRNMLILIATSMSMTMTMVTSMIFITITITTTTTSIMPIRITTLLTGMNTAMATITTIMGWARPTPMRLA